MRFLTSALAIALALPLSACLHKDRVARDEAAAIYARLDDATVNGAPSQILDAIQITLTKNLDLDHRNNDGMRALDLAVAKNRTFAAMALVAGGSNIWAINVDGDSAMHIGVRNHSVRTLLELRHYMPDLHQRNHAGKTPVDLARELRDQASIDAMTGPFPMD